MRQTAAYWTKVLVFVLLPAISWPAKAWARECRIGEPPSGVSLKNYLLQRHQKDLEVAKRRWQIYDRMREVLMEEVQQVGTIAGATLLAQYRAAKIYNDQDAKIMSEIHKAEREWRLRTPVSKRKPGDFERTAESKRLQDKREKLQMEYLAKSRRISDMGLRGPAKRLYELNKRQDVVLAAYTKARRCVDQIIVLSEDEVRTLYGAPPQIGPLGPPAEPTELKFYVMERKFDVDLEVGEKYSPTMSIYGGTPPYQLRITSSTGSRTLTMDKRGSVGNVTFQFPEPRIYTVTLVVEDSGLPRKWKQQTIVFRVFESDPNKRSLVDDLDVQVSKHSVDLQVFEKHNLSLTISGGRRPLRLRISSPLGSSQQEKIWDRELVIPFKFTKPGEYPVDFVVEDSSTPRKWKMEQVIFYVAEGPSETAKRETGLETLQSVLDNLKVKFKSKADALAAEIENLRKKALDVPRNQEKAGKASYRAFSLTEKGIVQDLVASLARQIGLIEKELAPCSKAKTLRSSAEGSWTNVEKLANTAKEKFEGAESKLNDCRSTKDVKQADDLFKGAKYFARYAAEQYTLAQKREDAFNQIISRAKQASAALSQARKTNTSINDNVKTIKRLVKDARYWADQTDKSLGDFETEQAKLLKKVEDTRDAFQKEYALVRKVFRPLLRDIKDKERAEHFDDEFKFLGAQIDRLFTMKGEIKRAAPAAPVALKVYRKQAGDAEKQANKAWNEAAQIPLLEVGETFNRCTKMDPADPVKRFAAAAAIEQLGQGGFNRWLKDIPTQRAICVAKLNQPPQVATGQTPPATPPGSQPPGSQPPAGPQQPPTQPPPQPPPGTAPQQTQPPPPSQPSRGKELVGFGVSPKLAEMSPGGRNPFTARAVFIDYSSSNLWPEDQDVTATASWTGLPGPGARPGRYTVTARFGRLSDSATVIVRETGYIPGDDPSLKEGTFGSKLPEGKGGSTMAQLSELAKKRGQGYVVSKKGRRGKPLGKEYVQGSSEPEPKEQSSRVYSSGEGEEGDSVEQPWEKLAGIGRGAGETAQPGAGLSGAAPLAPGSWQWEGTVKGSQGGPGIQGFSVDKNTLGFSVDKNNLVRGQLTGGDKRLALQGRLTGTRIEMNGAHGQGMERVTVFLEGTIGGSSAGGSATFTLAFSKEELGGAAGEGLGSAIASGVTRGAQGPSASTSKPQAGGRPITLTGTWNATRKK